MSQESCHFRKCLCYSSCIPPDCWTDRDHNQDFNTAFNGHIFGGNHAKIILPHLMQFLHVCWTFFLKKMQYERGVASQFLHLTKLHPPPNTFPARFFAGRKLFQATRSCGKEHIWRRNTTSRQNFGITLAAMLKLQFFLSLQTTAISAKIWREQPAGSKQLLHYWHGDDLTPAQSLHKLSGPVMIGTILHVFGSACHHLLQTCSRALCLAPNVLKLYWSAEAVLSQQLF